MVELIKDLSLVLQYIVPGFIFLCIFKFFTSRKMTETAMTIWSVVISYLIVAVVMAINEHIQESSKLTEFGEIIAPILVAIPLAVIVVVIDRCELFKNFVTMLNYKSIHDNIWDDMIDFKLGTTMYIYLSGKKYGYCGKLIEIEENGINSWFALTQYNKFDIETKKILPSPTTTFPTRLVLNLKDVEAIELVYNKDSKLIAR